MLALYLGFKSKYNMVCDFEIPWDFEEHKEIYYEECADPIVKTKSRWGFKRAGDVSRFQPESSQEGRRRWTPHIQDRQAESMFFSTQPLCSTLAFKESGEVCPHWVELCALLYLQIQMLLSSKSTPADLPRVRPL